MEGRRLASVLLLAALLLAAFAAVGQPPVEQALVRVAAPPGSDGPLVLLLTGDGNWAPFPKAFAETAAAHGAPVLGLKARQYMSHPVTPEGLARDLERAVRAQLETWHRRDLVVVGYSRGAEWTPFVVNRWPAELRARVRAIAFVGLGERASFEFHLDDLFRDVDRPTDVPIRAEVDKLVGIPMTCVYGEEKESFCTNPVPGMQSVEHSGGHRVKDDDKLIAYLLGRLGIAAETDPPSVPAGSTSP